MNVTIGVQRLSHAAGIELPRQMTIGAAGADLRAACKSVCEIAPGQRFLVPTGLVFEIPPGCEVQIRPRSGLAVKYGVTVLNAPGTVDSDYRGEIKVILINHGREPFRIERGDRIAQAVAARVVHAEYTEHASISGTERGDGGFGHTGGR
ncbi:MAG: dUTP diphosphatase [Fibrobacterota bacterium]